MNALRNETVILKHIGGDPISHSLSVMFSIIYLSKNIEFGIKQVLSVVTILRLKYIFLTSYLYTLYSHIYVLRHVLAVALASAP